MLPARCTGEEDKLRLSCPQGTGQYTLSLSPSPSEQQAAPRQNTLPCHRALVGQR